MKIVIFQFQMSIKTDWSLELLPPITITPFSTVKEIILFSSIHLIDKILLLRISKNPFRLSLSMLKKKMYMRSIEIEPRKDPCLWIFMEDPMALRCQPWLASDILFWSLVMRFSCLIFLVQLGSVNSILNKHWEESDRKMPNLSYNWSKKFWLKMKTSIGQRCMLQAVAMEDIYQLFSEPDTHQYSDQQS